MKNLNRVRLILFIVILAGVALTLFTLLYVPIKPSPTSTPVAIPSPTSTPLNLTPAQDWNTSVELVISATQGAWLRSEPSHLSSYNGMPVARYGAQARVIGKPVYEPTPGQWWWLVSSEDDAVGWVEEQSLDLSARSR